MSSDQTARKLIKLRAADNVVVEVEEEVAMEFVTVKSFFDMGDAAPSLSSSSSSSSSSAGPGDTAPVVPLQNVDSGILQKVVAYCKKHLELRGPAGRHDEEAAAAKKEEVERFDVEFLEENAGNGAMMCSLIAAADYLDVKQLADFVAEAVAEHIKDKSVEYVRDYFGIESDLTHEQEQALRAEAPWAHQPPL